MATKANPAVSTRKSSPKGKAAASEPTTKFIQRQEEIIAAASTVMNQRGLKGTTKASVAEYFGGGPSILTYYFRTKEEIAASCFLRAIEVYTKNINRASGLPSLEERVTQLIHNFCSMHGDISRGTLPAVVGFDDLRALGDQRVFDAYIEMFRHLRALLQPDRPERLERPVSIARTHFLLQQLFWMQVWLAKYNLEDYPRAAARMADILLHGLQARSDQRPPPPLPFDAPGDSTPAELFLRAATRIINEQGYFGASIDKISAVLDVTKGAFYYHLDRKDALVEACFTRTIDIIRTTQRMADDLPLDGYERLLTAVVSLVTHQLDGGSPLLRPATSSLPEPLKSSIISAYERNAVHFGSMISDAIADGSIRPIDAQIGAHMITAVINGSTELDQWIADETDTLGGESYILALTKGIAS